MYPGLLKHLSRPYLLSLLVLLCTAGSAAATCPDTDPLALEWLDKMSRSMRQLSYEGIVTLQRADELEVMQIVHAVDQGSSLERLTELTGQGAQIERAAHPLDCIHPGDRLLRLNELLQATDCGIARQYRFSIAEDERVAGRNAVRINIEPRDLYRYGYAMALDRDTGMLLKSQTIGHSRKALETMQFAHITYTEEMPVVGPIEVIHQAQHPHSDGAATQTTVSRAWNVEWVPRGFTATDQPLGNGARRTYTDGLAVFSVFLEDLDMEIRPGEGLVTQGGSIIYTRGMLVAGQPVLVTVIGEVPVNTARMVADSVGWVQ